MLRIISKIAICNPVFTADENYRSVFDSEGHRLIAIEKRDLIGTQLLTN